MKALKIIGIILLVIVAFILIVPLFLSDNVIVTQSKLMKAQVATIFHQVNTLKNWDKWSPFDDKQGMAVTYDSVESGVGARMSWTGKENGSLTILESTPYKSILTDIDYGQDGTTNGIWQFDKTPEGVMVTWAVKLTGLSYPIEKLFGLAMEGMMKPMLAKGLNDLKTLTEAIPAPPEISIVELKAQPSLVIYDSATIDGIGNLLSKNYSALMTYIMKKRIPVAGKPYAIYHNWDPEGMIRISAGIPIKGITTRGKKSIHYYELPAGKAVFAKHFGGYNTSNTHWAIDNYLKDYDLKTKDYIWEVYITDPSAEPDSAKWETDIYYPLK
jgi:effector-binding domain-containing protein